MSIPFGFIAKAEAFGPNTIIDDANGLMHLTEMGTYTPNSSSGDVVINFQSPCPSIPPPMVFLRSGNRGLCSQLYFVGSAGNWTGCRFKTYYASATQGSYFLGVLSPNLSGEQWGMRIRNGAGQLMYDSGLGYAQLTARLPGNTWTYQGKTRIGSTYYWNYTIANPDKNAYVLVNPWCAGAMVVKSRDAGATVAPSGFQYILRHTNDARDGFQMEFNQLNDNYDPNFTQHLLLGTPRG